jgi:hypothetical protein
LVQAVPLATSNIFPFRFQAYADTTVMVAGSIGGYGEDGGDVSLYNEASGGAYLEQDAYGGSGGYGNDALAPGQGGSASSILAGLTLGTYSTSYNVQAFGGQGGYAAIGSTIDGGLGGDAIAAFSLSGTGDISGSASATGGTGGAADGGAAYGSGNGGGGGTASLDTVYGKSTSGGTVNVNAVVTGGSGGMAKGNGNGGNGTAITLTNAVDGDTTGDLTLAQSANGGTGGWVCGSGNGGSGGAANATSQATSTNSTVDSYAFAYGGDGDNIQSGTGSAGNGGKATATATGTASITDPMNVFSYAYGGQGGINSSGNGNNGQGGAALATSTGSGSSGKVSAEATSYLGNNYSITASAAASFLNGTSQAVAGTSVGQETPSLPDTQGMQAAAEAFGTANSSTGLIYGILGGTASDSQTTLASLAYNLGMGELNNPQHLIVGLLGSSFTGTGFDSLEFSIINSNQKQQLFDETFTDPASAEAFFNNNVLDLGLVSTIADPNGDLGLSFQYNLFAPNNSGVNFNFKFSGNSEPISTTPIPGSVWLLGAGLLSLITFKRKCSA